MNPVMPKFRKLVWIPAFVIVVVLYLGLYAPGPVEGTYDPDLVCGCEDDYNFYYFKTNAMMQVFRTHPPVETIAYYHKSNSTWLLTVSRARQTNECRIEPHLFYMRIHDLGWRGNRDGEAWPRIFAFWKTGKILSDPEQWKPRPAKSPHAKKPSEPPKVDSPAEPADGAK